MSSHDAEVHADRRIGRFRNRAARDGFLAAYDRTMLSWPIPVRHHDVPTRFGTTHVLRAGSTAGTPIVLLHAIAVPSPSWAPSVAALAETHPLFAIDTLGDAGRSTQTARLRDAKDMAVWLDEVLRALTLDRVHLIGLSYGAWVALNQAERAPATLASIIAVDPPSAIGRPHGTFILGLLPDAFAAKAFKSEKAVHRLLARLNNGTVPEQPLLDLCMTGLRSYRAHLPAPRRLKDDDLRAITTPTLMVFGEQSPINHAARAAERCRTCMVDVHTEIIPDTGHMIPVDATTAFTNHSLQFIAKHDLANGFPTSPDH